VVRRTVKIVRHICIKLLLTASALHSTLLQLVFFSKLFVN